MAEAASDTFIVGVHLYTIGHSARSLDAVVNLLQENRVSALADIRTVLRSGSSCGRTVLRSGLIIPSQRGSTRLKSSTPRNLRQNQFLAGDNTSLVHAFNLLFQSLELRLIHAGYPFDRGPPHPLSQETLDHSYTFLKTAFF